MDKLKRDVATRPNATSSSFKRSSASQSAEQFKLKQRRRPGVCIKDIDELKRDVRELRIL